MPVTNGVFEPSDQRQFRYCDHVELLVTLLSWIDRTPPESIGFMKTQAASAEQKNNPMELTPETAKVV
ncbi:MAG: hypothetical protein WBM67_01420 [Sedimenticolaceae bacterium]